MHQYKRMYLQDAQRIAEIDATIFIKNIWRTDEGEFL